MSHVRYFSNDKNVIDQISTSGLKKTYFSSFFTSFFISLISDFVGVVIADYIIKSFNPEVKGTFAYILGIPLIGIPLSQIFVPFIFIFICKKLIENGKFGILSSIGLMVIIIIPFPFMMTLLSVLDNPPNQEPPDFDLLTTTWVSLYFSLYLIIVYGAPFGATFWSRLAEDNVYAFYSFKNFEDSRASPVDRPNPMRLVIVVRIIALMWWPLITYLIVLLDKLF